MKAKETKKKQLKIVLPDVDKKTYDRIVKIAAEEKRTIGKQTEYLAALAIEKLYYTK
jgi:hypothetical protein